ncbi:MAG TPA: ATP-binding protein [Actinomycetota bacterium]|nr:ATP-binding protein [Actinomycetota bacterium]
MRQSVALPLHFSIEFLGVAAYAGVVAWAVQSRRVMVAAGCVALLGSQVIHAAQLVESEGHPVVVLLRAAGLAVIALGLHQERRRELAEAVRSGAIVAPREAAGARFTAVSRRALGEAVGAVGRIARRGGREKVAPPATDGSEPDESPVPAVAAGAVGLSLLSAPAAALAAFKGGHLDDGKLWRTGWLVVAASELWLAVGGTRAEPLTRDLVPHVIRVAAFAVIGVWAWRRSRRSLQLRMVSAFSLVLVVVVVVVVGAVARVVASRLEDDQLDRITQSVRTEQTLFVRTNEEMRGDAVAVATFVATRRPGEDISGAFAGLLTGVYKDADLMILLQPGGVVGAEAGVEGDEQDLAARSPAAEAALARGEVPLPSVETEPGRVLVLASAPVFGPGAPTPSNVRGAVLLGRRVGAEDLIASTSPGGTAAGLSAAIIGSGGQVIASTGQLRDVVLPEAGRRALSGPAAVWRGRLESRDQTFLVGAVPLTGAGAANVSLLLAAPESRLVGTTLAVARALFIAVLASALVAILIGLWLGSRLARPVLRLADTARRVEEGDLEARPDVRSEDEIGTLARRFGDMTTALRDTISAEQSTRRRSEAIVEGMGDGLSAVDADFNILSFNPAAEAIAGVAASAAVGRKCFDVYGHLTSGRDGRPMCDSVCPLRHGGGREDVELGARDGRRLSLSVTCSPLRDAEGTLIGGVDLLRDVTPEVEAERTKAAVIRNVSHELRTPLTPILGYARIHERNPLPRQRVVSDMRTIAEEARKIQRFVNILVDLAAMDAGRMSVHPAPVRPSEIVKDAVKRWSDRAPGRVRGQAAASLPEVDADETLIGRALDELIDNAVKFAVAGRPVVVRATQSGRRIEVSVTDRGPGIERSTLPSLMQDFSQGDASDTRAAGGMGIGLPFVRRVVEAHGTKLRVQSVPGLGSTFSFSLPVVPKSRRPKSAAAAKGRG